MPRYDTILANQNGVVQQWVSSNNYIPAPLESQYAQESLELVEYLAGTTIP